jgi:UDP-N-acetyl-D-mannosaminuronate dehydrogenase
MKLTLNWDKLLWGMSEYMDKMKVCVLGLGNIGLPVAQYAHAKGLEVWGYDINPSTVENAEKSGKFKVTGSWKDVPQLDAYIICVTTGQVNECPDLSAVFDVCKNIGESLFFVACVYRKHNCSRYMQENS